MKKIIRLFLETAVKSKKRVKLGSLLAQIGRECGGVDLAIERDRTPAEPALSDSPRPERRV